MGDESESRPDGTEEFAADLRQLRLDAGSPTLARLQHETGISRSVLSDAFAGKYLPSARTVDALIRVLGGESRAWIERRDALGAKRDPSVAEESAHEEAAPPRRGIRRRTVALVAVGAFVLGAVVSSLTTTAMVTSALTAPTAEPQTEVTPLIAVDNGVDPALTECVDDAKVATAENRVDNTLLEIIWSNKCYAGWARITRYDEKYDGNTVTIAIYPEPAPDGASRQEATEHDVQGAYTHLVVRPTPDTLLCAEGSFTVDGESFDLGEPLCI